ncbi:Na+ antiporter [Cryptobacterium curtum DSM 15641]|uniref:Na+ antiporter n=1 Tax=Cryptobacterium curtum (strain ATCC 700683 / DSM 15641 / CCUG 43107 / 12-3) TaxID=469378 RepID=C7MPC6_CRYCD|nr:Na+/H+ antiporter [Cryptobacterium curtum]ACU94766.1 Na+ antiporter [Cryptobacterium curtum DSM 15641]
METFELVLILLACVILSAVLDQVVRRVSLPLAQIAIGLIAALILPAVNEVYIESELFLVLFIAPLLFNEAREANIRALWTNKGSILSLAIGLVLATVLVVGFTLNWIVPSIPLAAAFALAAALGPTDAAAVGALGSQVNLSRRQSTLLSGESLINDASGVVSFQFAIAAVTTGAFSASEAGGTFLVLFVGGIVAGLLFGFIATATSRILRRSGVENTTVHVLYEVFTPFIVFLLAEALDVSGILAVVAAGLVMSDRSPRLVSTDLARQSMVSNSFWEVIVFLINGVIFVMLGMQLPQAVSPTLNGDFSFFELVGLVVGITFLVVLCRFLWIAAMELIHRDEETGERGITHIRNALKNALVMTIAGPKGAVTLSIIFTIPYTLDNGVLFPARDFLIFLAAGVILLTLLLADTTLPRLIPKDDDAAADDDRALRRATIEVLERTIQKLRSWQVEHADSEYTPALRLTIMRYRTRLVRERMELDQCGAALRELNDEVHEKQRAMMNELESSIKEDSSLSFKERTTYQAMFNGIRRSIGYTQSARVGSRVHVIIGLLGIAARRRQHYGEEMNSSDEQLYYIACLYAIELEQAAIDYLEEVIASSSLASGNLKAEVRADAKTAVEVGSDSRGGSTLQLDAQEKAEVQTDTITEIESPADTAAGAQNNTRAAAARVLINEHRAAIESLESRISQRQTLVSDMLNDSTGDQPAEVGGTSFAEQFGQARKYADQVDAYVLDIELDEIRHLRNEGKITDNVARELRKNVHLLQMSLDTE